MALEIDYHSRWPIRPDLDETAIGPVFESSSDHQFIAACWTARFVGPVHVKGLPVFGRPERTWADPQSADLVREPVDQHRVVRRQGHPACTVIKTHTRRNR